MDFVLDFDEASIHKALSDLARAGTIRRVCHGVYDYPRHCELLGQDLSPDMDQVAQALARKFHWRIQPSGDTALNVLGLSTQVPGRWLYHSNGPSRQYSIANQTLAFRKAALKDTGFRHRKSAPVVEALKALGRERVDASAIRTMREYLGPEDCARVLRETRQVTGWIYQIIKQVCGEAS